MPIQGSPGPSRIRASQKSNSMQRTLKFSTAMLICFGILALVTAQTPSPLETTPKPADIPGRWKGYIGEYGSEQASAPISIVNLFAEKDGEFEELVRVTSSDGIRYSTEGKFRVSGSSPEVHGFRTGTHNQREWHSGDVVSVKTTPEFDAGAQVLIKPVRPVDELRAQALSDSPPHEEGNFRKPELVELTTLDPAIHLDIRYATTNDFLGTPVYTQARAFLQRPAAEALVRALHKLQPLGYGLLIHDAYRPWYVTKIFWDATPPEGKIFVADPSQGSRHNRGCAADLTLYDLASGKPIEMPGTYDEMSPRSFPDYPGGTSLQRWHRDLLRRAMESEGFTVYEHEWWHFDYKDWHEYPILNIKFEDLHSGQGLASAQ